MSDYRRHAMNRVPSFEQQQRSRIHRDPHHLIAGAFEQTLDARIVFIGGAANQRNVFEIAAGLRGSQRNRGDEVSLIVMPMQSFAFTHHGEIERAHRIGVAKESILFQRRRNEFHERIPFEQLSHRRIVRKLIVSDDTYRGRLEKFARMIVRPGGDQELRDTACP